MIKPELLAPAGNIEAFHAAIQAQADAVYLGLRQFNARERAQNFTLSQLKALLDLAKENNTRIYITLNTLIKNSELPELFDILYTLEKMQVDAVIIQDLGVIHLISKYFPRLKMHASTQMAIHNSQGADFCRKIGLQRVILARELTFSELSELKKQTSIDLEIFIHGSLCYSFSGMCLFSSFLGGMSANRGNCRQPCRRKYQHGKDSSYLFNLKDNLQAPLINKLARLGISSLKIEGRMKSADYVYHTVTAYRQLIDDQLSLKKILPLLNNDMARQKTAYFLGGNLKDAISDLPYTGTCIGEVSNAKKDVVISTDYLLKTGDRLRILSTEGYNSDAYKIKNLISNSGTVTLPDAGIKCQKGDKVFLLSSITKKFPSRLKGEETAHLLKFSQKRKTNIINSLTITKPPAKEEIFLRINEIKWLRKIYLDKIDFLILALDYSQLKKFALSTSFLKANSHKFLIQLPRFIPQKKIQEYNKEILRLHQEGISQFMLSHLSQRLFFDDLKKIRLYTSENSYVLNDAASALLKEQGITNWVYPFENDFPNLISGKDRRGIVPLFFYPELFISRMPVNLPDDAAFMDERQQFIKKNRDSLTIIIPQQPVSLLQFHRRLSDKGFARFLIDLSWTLPSSSTYNRIIKNFQNSTPEQPASTFNFKTTLK